MRIEPGARVRIVYDLSRAWHGRTGTVIEVQHHGPYFRGRSMIRVLMDPVGGEMSAEPESWTSEFLAPERYVIDELPL